MEVSEIKGGRLAGWQADGCAGGREYLRFFWGGKRIIVTGWETSSASVFVCVCACLCVCVRALCPSWYLLLASLTCFSAI